MNVAEQKSHDMSHGWKPINTAPKDKFVLLACPSGYTTTPWVFTTGILHSDYKVGRWVDHANDDLSDWGMSPIFWRDDIITPDSATPAPAPAQGEPFGYFRAEPFGWTDCSEDAEGAIALYEHPAKPEQEVGQAIEAGTTVKEDYYLKAYNLSKQLADHLSVCPAPSQPVAPTDEQALKDAFEEGYCARSTYNDVDTSDCEAGRNLRPTRHHLDCKRDRRRAWHCPCQG